MSAATHQHESRSVTAPILKVRSLTILRYDTDSI